MSSGVAWLLVEEGHPKHTGLWHPPVALALALAWVWLCSALAHDWAVGAPAPEPIFAPGVEAPSSRNHDAVLARALCAYWALLCGLRLPSLGAAQVAYEGLWSCNVALLLAAVGLATQRPHLVSAAAISVKH